MRAPKLSVKLLKRLVAPGLDIFEPRPNCFEVLALPQGVHRVTQDVVFGRIAPVAINP